MVDEYLKKRGNQLVIDQQTLSGHPVQLNWGLYRQYGKVAVNVKCLGVSRQTLLNVMRCFRKVVRLSLFVLLTHTMAFL